MDENNQSAQQPATPQQMPAAAPAPEPTPVQQAQQTVTGGKKSKTPLIIGIIIAALVVVGAIAYGVYAYVTNQPDYMLNKSIEQLSKETAVAAKFKLTSGAESGTTFSGDFAVRAEGKNGEAVIGIGSGDSRVGITARALDDTTYLRFGSLGNFVNLMKTISPDQAATYEAPEFKAALDRINNKWFSLTKEEVAGVAQTTVPSAPAGSSLKPEDLRRLGEIYNKHQFFKADKIYADEAVEGVNTAHFSIKIDKATYKSFLNELKAANLESFKVTDQNIADADKDADEFTSKSVVEFWVARDSKKLKQFKAVTTEKGSEGSLTLTFVSQMPQFEKLEKPAETTPFSELMTTFLGQTPETGTMEE